MQRALGLQSVNHLAIINGSMIVPPPMSQDVSLLALEQALEDVLALIVWSVTNLGAGYKQNASETVGSSQVLQTHLNLNMTPVIAGGIVSLILFILSLALTWRTREQGKRSETSHLDSMGLLQILWLSGQYPVASQQLADKVRQPSTNNLRRIGNSLSLWPTSESDMAVHYETRQHIPGSGPVHLLQHFDVVSLHSSSSSKSLSEEGTYSPEKEGHQLVETRHVRVARPIRLLKRFERVSSGSDSYLDMRDEEDLEYARRS